jgi:molybdenum cofactor biosynthesis enzyme MoaA
VPSQITVEDNVRYINKSCPEHGDFKIVQDPDAEFCEKLEQRTNKIYNKILMIETTNRCQLDCPHCYHMPNNKDRDIDLAYIYNNIRTAPAQLKNIILAGAEPSVRKDLFDIIDCVHQDGRVPSILTNGVRLVERKFVENLLLYRVKNVLIGLNHWSYQGKDTHERQLAGIKNCIDMGMHFHYIGYTVESYEHLRDVLEEINSFPAYNQKKKYQFRIRLGSNIGRVPNEPTAYISKNYKEIERMAKSLGHELTSAHDKGDDNMYHMMAHMNGHTLRIIQWPDATNIDMQQLKHSPWARFNRQGYLPNFVHQVITRDAYVNKGLPVLDRVPEAYTYSEKNDGDIT